MVEEDLSFPCVLLVSLYVAEEEEGGDGMRVGGKRVRLFLLVGEEKAGGISGRSERRRGKKRVRGKMIVKAAWE